MKFWTHLWEMHNRFKKKIKIDDWFIVFNILKVIIHDFVWKPIYGLYTWYNVQYS